MIYLVAALGLLVVALLIRAAGQSKTLKFYEQELERVSGDKSRIETEHNDLLNKIVDGEVTEQLEQMKNVTVAALETELEQMKQGYENRKQEIVAKLKEYEENLVAKQLSFQESVKSMSDALDGLRKEYRLENEKLRAESERRKKEIASVREAYIRELDDKNPMKGRLRLTEQELEGMHELTKMAAKFPIINSAISNILYKFFFEKALEEVIRENGVKSKVSGIYLIEDTTTGRCYVGQGVDVGNRWKQHVKRGLGLEKQTKNILYTAMEQNGVENFRFTLLEKVDKADLSEREKYWGQVYSAGQTGLNIRLG